MKKCKICREEREKEEVFKDGICLDCILKPVKISIKHQIEKKGYFYTKGKKKRDKAIRSMQKKSGRAWTRWKEGMLKYLVEEEAKHKEELRKRRDLYGKRNLTRKTGHRELVGKRSISKRARARPKAKKPKASRKK